MISNKNRTTFVNEDYLDFSYNGKKASEMGLIKVNKGKRQDDIILPTSKDTTIDVPGVDGVYYLKSKFQQREFTIDFAYDGLYEDDIRAIREWLAPQKECQLIFSEYPYKYYMAKPKSAPKLSYIAFDDEKGDRVDRVYRGEGTVQFVCYYPWARSISRFKKDFPYATEQQLAESGLIAVENEDNYNKFDESGTEIKCWNGGQMPTSFKFIFQSYEPTSGYTSLKVRQNGTILGQIWLNGDKSLWITDKDEQPDNNPWYLLDFENHLILRIKNVTTVGDKVTYDIEESKGNAIIMNSAIVAGDFFNLPVGESTLIIDSNGLISENNYHFLYDYLYY